MQELDDGIITVPALIVPEDLDPFTKLKVIFKGGDKCLNVYFESDLSFASAYIYKDEITAPKPIPGMTTRLYEKAYGFFQGVANSYDRQLLYVFSSSNERMMAWAMDSDKGARVFSWDQLIRTPESVLAWKTFKPMYTKS